MMSSVAPLAHPVAAACARLGIGRTLFYELIARDEIRVIKIGCKTLVPESELQRLIEERMAQQAAA